MGRAFNYDEQKILGHIPTVGDVDLSLNTEGDVTANTINATVTFKDVEGNDINDTSMVVRVWVSDNATGVGVSGDASTTLASTGGTDLQIPSNGLDSLMILKSGDTIDVAETAGANTFYLSLVTDKRHFVSSVLTFT